MNDNWKIIVLAVGFFLSVCGVIAGLAYRDITDVGECVLIQPREADSGSISSSGHVFHLDYSGTTKETGWPCTVRSLVTVFEYDRMMYTRGTDEKD